ncbi:MAG: cytochrome P450 [Actinobacteria bacterium]|nr:cytochrome P450 [Actinomycetota bacterium]
MGDVTLGRGVLAPSSNLALYTDDVLADPWPTYQELRDLGGTVWLEQYGMFVHPRFEECRAALRDSDTYTSAQGVMMNDLMNETLQGILLCTDGEEHSAMRKVIGAPLTPSALASQRERITDEAEQLVERLVEQGRFDAATELAHHLPVTIVSELVGLPETGRERMIEWAHANFDCFGPPNARTEAAFPIVEEMVAYASNECVPGKLRPGGWAAQIWEAAERGDIAADKPPAMMNDYMGPSLDTTIFATASMIRLFAEHPDQWTRLREQPDLALNAINEVLRIETVLHTLSRVLTVEHTVDGVTMPAGSRVIILYASANRDERQFRDPDVFDITRSNAAEHLGLGFGTHSCPGGNLARIEMRALLTALLPRVERFDLVECDQLTNNVLHGLGRCIVDVRRP